jgi:cysteine desulfurase/selenocysteine lyase
MTVLAEAPAAARPAPAIGASQQASLRALFPGCSQQIYLDTAGRNLVATPVRAAIDRYLDGRMLGGDKKKMFETVERARAGFAKIIGASPEEIAITKNISEGINIIAHAVDWRAHDNVVICGDVEHPNNIYPWIHAAQLYGTEVRNVRSRDGHIDAGVIGKAVDARTRIVSLSGTSFLPGFRVDLAEIQHLCKKAGAEFVVDGAQSVGIQAIDAKGLGLGAIAASTQKGLLGLYGMGFLYCRKDWAERITPRYLARFGVDVGDRHEADLDNSENIKFREGALRFDLGNYNFLGAAALEPGLAILQSVGVPAIDRYTHQLSLSLCDGLRDLGMPVIGWPAGPHIGSIVAIGSLTPDPAMIATLTNLWEYLQRENVKLSERRGCLRFSFHVYNNDDDVNELLRLIQRWQQR